MAERTREEPGPWLCAEEGRAFLCTLWPTVIGTQAQPSREPKHYTSETIPLPVTMHSSDLQQAAATSSRVRGDKACDFQHNGEMDLS